MKELNWQVIEIIYPGSPEQLTKVVSRLRIPGGWILQSVLRKDIENNNPVLISISNCFVPDATHAWLISEGDF